VPLYAVGEKDMTQKRIYGLLFVLLVLVGIGSHAFVGRTNPSRTANGTQSIETNEVKADAKILLDVKSAYLVDYETNTVLFEHNPDKRQPIASMVKIMTLILAYEAIEGGQFSLDSDIVVSENAASMGGSQVFLDANTTHKMRELLKAITVSSANDACVAVAEAVSGSVEGFVQKMNERAASLGMQNTKFSNTTGLPDDIQYSTAKDSSIMMRELLKHKDYFNNTTIWLENYQHPCGRVTEMTNTNKLIRFYKGCDSGKTGFTQQSMYCLAASAKRDNMRVVAVVLGGSTSGERFEDIKKLFNFAFSNYKNEKVVSCEKPLEQTVRVTNSKTSIVRVAPEKDIFHLVKIGEKSNITLDYAIKENTKAPVKVGTVLGEIIIKDKGVEIARCKAVSLDDAPKSKLFDRVKGILSKFF
jgi:D-alanyl-D-alanine carboxypeptidase (penicillin-binding protein 5/6)